MIVGVLASVFAVLAAGLHVWIFVMESITWQTPRTWRRFGVRDQASADILRPMAYNQGFYNLFLAVLVAAGIALFALGHPLVGATLVLAGTGSMVAAGLVLALSSPAKRRAALVQAGPPLLAILLLGTALAGAATMAG